MLCSVDVVVRFLCYVFFCVLPSVLLCVSSVWYESGFVPNNRQWILLICCVVLLLW